MEADEYEEFIHNLQAHLSVLNHQQLSQVAHAVEVEQVNRLAQMHGHDHYSADGLAFKQPITA